MCVFDFWTPNRSSSGSSSSRSSSDSSSSNSDDKKKKKIAKKKSSKVKKAERKSAAKQTEVFSKAAAKEHAKKQKEAEKLRVKAIAAATTLIAKIKKQVQEMRRTLVNPLICHAPSVTQQPLHDLIKQYDSHLKLLDEVVAGDREWQAELGSWSPKEGTTHMKIVASTMGQLAKLKPKTK